LGETALKLHSRVQVRERRHKIRHTTIPLSLLKPVAFQNLLDRLLSLLLTLPPRLLLQIHVNVGVCWDFNRPGRHWHALLSLVELFLSGFFILID